jgi:hypothetical protein
LILIGKTKQNTSAEYQWNSIVRSGRKSAAIKARYDSRILTLPEPSSACNVSKAGSYREMLVIPSAPVHHILNDIEARSKNTALTRCRKERPHVGTAHEEKVRVYQQTGRFLYLSWCAPIMTTSSADDEPLIVTI